MLSEGIRKSGWKSAFIIRLIYIPNGIKDYAYPILGGRFLPFIVSSAVMNAVFAVEVSLISISLTDTDELLA